MGRGRRESRQMKGCDRRPWAWEEAHLCLSQEAGATQHGWHSPCLWFSLGSAPHWATRVGPLVPQTCPRQAFPKPSCLGFPDGSQCPRPHLHCCLQKLGSSLLTLSPCSGAWTGTVTLSIAPLHHRPTPSSFPGYAVLSGFCLPSHWTSFHSFGRLHFLKHIRPLITPEN